MAERKRRATKKESLLNEYVKAIKDLKGMLENELKFFSDKKEVLKDNLPPLDAISDAAFRVAKAAEQYRGFILGEEQD